MAPIFFAGVMVAICSPVVAFAQSTPANFAAARAAASAGRYGEAAQLAEQALRKGPFERADVAEAIEFTQKGKDPAAGARIREIGLLAGKLEWPRASVAPLLYRQAGDEANAVRVSDVFKDYWAKMPKTSPASAREFLPLDLFTVDGYQVFATECLDQSGRFGIGTMFTVHQRTGGPVEAKDVLFLIAVEHNKLTAQVMKETGRGDGRPRPSLDAFTGNAHITLGFFDAEPPYTALRTKVAEFLQKNTQASPPFGQGTWARMGCGS